MCAGLYAVGFAESDGFEHDGRITGVEAACNVCGVEEGHQLFVGTLLMLATFLFKLSHCEL